LIALYNTIDSDRVDHSKEEELSLSLSSAFHLTFEKMKKLNIAAKSRSPKAVITPIVVPFVSFINEQETAIIISAEALISSNYIL